MRPTGISNNIDNYQTFQLIEQQQSSSKGVNQQLVYLQDENNKMKSQLSRLREEFKYLTSHSIRNAKEHMRMIKQNQSKQAMLNKAAKKLEKYKTKCAEVESDLNTQKIELESYIQESRCKQDDWINMQTILLKKANKLQQLTKGNTQANQIIQQMINILKPQ